MAKEILQCPACSMYSLKMTCPNCEHQTIPVLPPKFSPEDKYAEYRRQSKRAELEQAGLV